MGSCRCTFSAGVAHFGMQAKRQLEAMLIGRGQDVTQSLGLQILAEVSGDERRSTVRHQPGSILGTVKLSRILGFWRRIRSAV